MSAAQMEPVGLEAEPSQEHPAVSADPVNILLVDDRAENLRVLEAILEPLGQTLIHASSGEEALRELLLRDFAVILLDVQMPGMNGLETARYVKSRPRTRTVPIIFLTAINKDESHIFRAYEVGAVDYLFKPFDPEILRSKVSVFVDLWRQQQQIKLQEETIRESQRRELELEHRTRILETEARTAAELSSLNAALSRRTAEMERAIAARSRFYASMSHELRTPINAVLGYSTLLLDNIYGPLTPQQREGLERTHRAAKHLLELVNDVLDLSKIEAGKIELAVQSVGFPSLIEDLFVTVRPLASENATELLLEVLGEGISIRTDPRRVRQILLNLLSNAIKFGNGKPVRVEYRPTAEGGVHVEVVDEGGGIAPGDLVRIFDEFVQLSGEDQRQQRGTGLGLAISRRLAELLDGTLEVESTPGVGSRFCLTLPPSVDAAGSSENEATGR
jgi:two-component system, sensor histidine kinase